MRTPDLGGYLLLLRASSCRFFPLCPAHCRSPSSSSMLRIYGCPSTWATRDQHPTRIIVLGTPLPGVGKQSLLSMVMVLCQ